MNKIPALFHSGIGDSAVVYLPLHALETQAHSESLFYCLDAEDSEASSQKPREEKAVTPSPEQVFAECSQKRILGLLAAMLPPLKSVRAIYF